MHVNRKKCDTIIPFVILPLYSEQVGKKIAGSDFHFPGIQTEISNYQNEYGSAKRAYRFCLRL